MAANRGCFEQHFSSSFSLGSSIGNKSLFCEVSRGQTERPLRTAFILGRLEFWTFLSVIRNFKGRPNTHLPRVALVLGCVTNQRANNGHSHGVNFFRFCFEPREGSKKTWAVYEMTDSRLSANKLFTTVNYILMLKIQIY